MTDEYRISTQQVVDECCPCIVEEACSETECGPGRLELFRQWLLKRPDEAIELSPIEFRLAPSIVVRSEAELFGVSSPRFAIRAYLNEKSFVNIRRSQVLKGMIEETIPAKNDGKGVREALVAELKKGESSWMADSFFEIPRRFELHPDFRLQFEDELSGHDEKAGGYYFLTSDLGNEYGEEFDGPLVPFVTHISVGGGLCAQAACFMSICLADAKQVVGISEITKLAWQGSDQPDGVVNIHGLSSEMIADFYSQEEIGLQAQLQTFIPVKGDGNGDETYPKESRFIRHAIQSYIANKIPLNVIVSISRMKGWHLESMMRDNPIVGLQGYEFSDHDRSVLPLGIKDKKGKAVPRNDHHCVVIVGASNEKVCINDPATFPFLEAHYGQLIDARAYMPRKGEQIGANENGEEYILEEDEVLKPLDSELAPFRMIAVTPANVRAPLLDFSREPEVNEDMALEEDSTRLARPKPVPGPGIMRIAFDRQQEERLGSGIEQIVPKLGKYFLAEKTTDAKGQIFLRSWRDGLPDFDRNLLSEVENDIYWVQFVEHDVQNLNGEWQEKPTLWFWRASATEDEIYSSHVVTLVQSHAEDGSTVWEPRR